MLCFAVLALLLVCQLCSSAFVPVQSHHFSREDDMQALIELRDDVANFQKRTKFCRPIEYGIGYGSHSLCDHFVTDKFQCYFLSFGIQKDYSFDKMLHEKRNCTGLGLDPTTDYPSELTPGVSFLKAGANSPQNWRFPDWEIWAVPTLRKKKFDHPLFALKMDCEGCEYSLAQDIIREDPNFFARVLQFNVEVHLPQAIVQTDQHVYDLGRLIRLIYLSGMELVHFDHGMCNPKEMVAGCHKLLRDIQFPCHRSCRSYLFTHKFQTHAEWKALLDSVNIS
jgi:hypothetical protein